MFDIFYVKNVNGIEYSSNLLIDLLNQLHTY
uniref:Uncharacterized protein n=1 Tax=Musa acuminata subsp. malaccensis TaxID=214687 RepID=A0A804JW47_MUSAM